jgi:hypothetical protein
MIPCIQSPSLGPQNSSMVYDAVGQALYACVARVILNVVKDLLDDSWGSGLINKVGNALCARMGLYINVVKNLPDVSFSSMG